MTGHRLEDQSDRFSTSAIQIKGEVGDALYLKARDVAASQPEAHANRVVFGCNITRSYTRLEIEQGKLFLIQVRYQHGAAEEFGTWYTDARPNPDCGIGRLRLRVVETNPFRSVIEETPNLSCALSSRQIGPLHFPFLKFVKRDIFSLWGGETIISERLAKLIEGGGFKGGKARPIWNTRRGAQSLQDLSDCPTGMSLLARAKTIGLVPGDRAFWSWLEADEQLPDLEKALWEQMEIWEARRSGPPPTRVYFELKVDSPPLQVAVQTVLGDPFFGGLMDHCQCENGEIRGMLCSRLSIKASSWDGSDICQTDLFFGGRQGLFRPWRPIVVSKRLFDAMREGKMKLFQFEIVEMV